MALAVAVGDPATPILDADGALRVGDERNPLRLVRLQDGHAVLIGFSLDHGKTMKRFWGMDTSSQAPKWVPRALHQQARRGEMGFLYWFQEGVWQRMKYKQEDGVMHLTAPFRDAESLAVQLGGSEAAHALVAAADERRVTEALLTAFGAPPGAPTRAAELGLTAAAADDDRLLAAMQAAGELPGRQPPEPTQPLYALTGLLNQMSKRSGGEATFTTCLGIEGTFAQPELADDPALILSCLEFARQLRAAETEPPRGSWLFLRVHVGPAVIADERAYDHCPPWFDARLGLPDDEIAAEVAARAPAWRPAWAAAPTPRTEYPFTAVDELPPPAALWARIAVTVIAWVAWGWEDVATLDEHGLNISGERNLMRVGLLSGERAFIVGRALDYGDTQDRGLDLLAGAPAWLSRPLAEEPGLGFVYWFDDEWDHAPYPDGAKDGLDAITHGYYEPENTTGWLEDFIWNECMYEDLWANLHPHDAAGPERAAVAAEAAALVEAAEARTVTIAHLQALFGRLATGGSPMRPERGYQRAVELGLTRARAVPLVLP